MTRIERIGNATLHLGDCRTILPSLAAGSVQCCVTSPPYYGLRAYLPDGHSDKGKEIGLEPTPDEYVAEMVAVFREVRRVLRDDGTCWLNVGDSYAMSTKGAGGVGKQHTNAGSIMADRSWRIPQGYKPKDLLGIPWMLAFALRADGWYLRSAIVWHKPNPMPESVIDRPTSAYENLFLLSKRAEYFYDGDAIAEDSIHAGKVITLGEKSLSRGQANGANVRPSGNATKDSVTVTATRNARNVWTIATQPFKGAHFATMPPLLAEQCIKAGTSERGCCSACGAPWVRQTEKTRTFESGSGRAGNLPTGKNGATMQGGGETVDIRRGPVVHSQTTGWLPSCSCDAPTRPCVVLDPFAGAGTTGLVADRLGRDAVLIELNAEYCDLETRRIYEDAPLFAASRQQREPAPVTPDLFA